MLPKFRALLVNAIRRAIMIRANFERVLAAVGQLLVVQEAPGSSGNGTYLQLIEFVVNHAVAKGWIENLVDRLVTDFPAMAEFQSVKKHLLAERPTKGTNEDPVQEVLLGSDRPFVNRRDLRNAFLRLADANGDRVLLVDGKEKTGKSYSYYLLHHAGDRRGFKVHLFELKNINTLPQLAGDVLLSVVREDRPLPPQGTESAERWAEKLANLVGAEVSKSNQRRFFVFDKFPDAPLPPECLAFLVRLTRHAEQETRELLRVVLISSPASSPARSATSPRVRPRQRSPPPTCCPRWNRSPRPTRGTSPPPTSWPRSRHSRSAARRPSAIGSCSCAA